MNRFMMIAAGAVISFTASVSSAGTYDHFDSIAKDLERQANLFVRETRHFRHTPQYRHLLHDALQLARTARHAHVTAHIGCNLAHLEKDVQLLDSTLHHVADLVRDIERHSRHGYGHTHGDTRHVHQLLRLMVADVHHLLADLRSFRGHHDHGVIGIQPVVTRRTPVGWGNHSIYDSHRIQRGGIHSRNDSGHGARHDSHIRSGRNRGVMPGWGNSSVHFGIGF